MPTKPLSLAQHADADALLTRDPLALLIGMVLDQQIPLEHAFHSPYELTQRLGRNLDAEHLAGYDPNKLAEIFSTPPALHRFPGSMAARVQKACAHLVDHYGGDTASLWSTARTGDELVHRLQELPGFGAQKARIFAALLGKQCAVRPKGWREACVPYGEAGARYSVADITDAKSLLAVREHKAQMKAAAKLQG